MENNLIAVVIAGGHGECLRQGEDYVPKLLLPVQGRPLLEHQLAWLKTCGIESAVLCLDHRPEAVRDGFGDGSRFGMKLRYHVEDIPRGTAGVVKALGAASLPENILVLYGGIFPQTDGKKMLEFHGSHKALATLVLHHCKRVSSPAALPDCDPCHGCEGAPVVLGPDRKIIDFPHMKERTVDITLSPLWILRREILHFVPDAAASDFVKDIFPAVVKAGQALAGYPEAGRLIELGSAPRYQKFVGGHKPAREKARPRLVRRPRKKPK